MATEKIYRSVIGFVQFEPGKRDLSDGRVVRDVLVQSGGSEGGQVRVTLWPEFAGIEINQGDFIAAQGLFEINEYKKKSYAQISARQVVVLAQSNKTAEVVENALDDEDEEENLF